MDAASIIFSMNVRRQSLGMTYQELADKAGKDITTVCRQLSVKNPGFMLATMDEYAHLLDGEIMFIPHESIKKISAIEHSTERMQELTTQNDRLREKLAEKDAQIIELQKSLTSIVEKIADKL